MTVVVRTRSPNFPVIDLEVAIELAKQLEQHAKRHPLPVSALIEKAWKLKASSSRGLQLIGALKQFGLIQDEGSGDNRRVKLTEEGAKVVLNHPDRSRLLKEMAIAPKVYETLWNKFVGESLPPDETLTHYLLFDHDPPFNRASIDAFLKGFRRTIEFSGLALSLESMDNSTPFDGLSSDEININKGNDCADDNDASRVIQKPKAKVGMRQEVFTLDEGDIVLQWPEKLSKESYEDFESWINIVLRKAKRAIIDKENDGVDDLV